MPLSLQEVEHIADLARLELSAEEKKRYRVQLSAILEHVAQLQKLDTTSIQPTSSVFNTQTPLRADEPHPCLPVETLLRTSAQKERSQFKIPPVFE